MHVFIQIHFDFLMPLLSQFLLIYKTTFMIKGVYTKIEAIRKRYEQFKPDNFARLHLKVEILDSLVEIFVTI